MTKQYDNFADLITFTRASTGTYLDSDGLLKTATTNTPRIEYDINGNRKGLLIEEARTNSVRNSVAGGAVVGSPGNLPTHWAVFGGTAATEIVGVGTENGSSYVDVRITGAPSSVGILNFENSAGIAVTEGQSRTLSFKARIVAGDTTNVNELKPSINWRDGGGFVSRITGADFKDDTSTSSRTLSGVAPAGITFVLPQIVLNCSGAVDFTLRISSPQLEEGSFPTSYIPTAGAAASRSADVASIPTSAFGYNQKAGTVVVDFEVSNHVSGSRRLFSLNTNFQNRMDGLLVSNGQFQQFVIDGGSTQANPNTPNSVTNNEPSKVAAVYALNDFASVLDGGAIQTDTSGTVPSVSTLSIGNSPVGNWTNGHIKSLSYFPRRLTNSQLQRLTS